MMMHIFRNCRRAGTATLEFAIVAPVLVAILVGLMDWGLAVESRLRLQTAARAGAQYAITSPTDTAGITAAVQAAAPDFASLSTSSTGIWCECGGTATACTNSCLAGMQRFLRVDVSHPYTPFTPAGPTSVAANVTLRLQ
ncbi:MAG TPA: TadE/TadG family type IV pilus assembly protein [Falsiroseomonas sp.]|jgi:Flp pilus assembly protein TadG|nr:TadE/TadG family type IV pilus assembly protein [Falsiroseomonas sp.]